MAILQSSDASDAIARIRHLRHHGTCGYLNMDEVTLQALRTADRLVTGI